MPDTREHRGPGPKDEELFGDRYLEKLRQAVGDLSWLLSRGYASKSSVKLVGDRYELRERQRIAIMRNACSDEQLESRKKREVGIGELRGEKVFIDGYNLLITIEAAMSGGAIFVGRDGCLRDIASVHGTYRKVSETVPAIELIAEYLGEKGVVGAEWLLDRPVSNSGRLKTLISRLSETNGWGWQVKLLYNPDKELKETEGIVVSSDSDVIDGCGRWVNLAGGIISEKLPKAWVIELDRRRP